MDRPGRGSVLAVPALLVITLFMVRQDLPAHTRHPGASMALPLLGYVVEETARSDRLRLHTSGSIELAGSVASPPAGYDDTMVTDGWEQWWLELCGVVIGIFTVVAMGRLSIVAVRQHEQGKRRRMMAVAVTTLELERERIARDLHDSVGQLLAVAGINMERLREMIEWRQQDAVELEELKGSLDRTIAIIGRAGGDVRAISHALGARTVQVLGLTAAVDELLNSLPARTTPGFEFVAVNMEERLPVAVETGLFRIAQELVANVLRHARATESTVQIVRARHEVRLSVEDNGRGFDPERVRGGMGQQNIAARVAAMGGRVCYDSTPGHGTTVTVVVAVDPGE